MREVLFRGKHKGNGQWAFGDLIQIPNKGYCSIMEQRAFAANTEVDPETVGQFTGLTDKNGKKIFEGDVVTFKTTAYSFKPCVVAWSFKMMRFILRGREANYPIDIDFKYEVIGNIHDNPELLGGAEDGN